MRRCLILISCFMSVATSALGEEPTSPEVAPTTNSPIVSTEPMPPQTGQTLVSSLTGEPSDKEIHTAIRKRLDLRAELRRSLEIDSAYAAARNWSRTGGVLIALSSTIGAALVLAGVGVGVTGVMEPVPDHPSDGKDETRSSAGDVRASVGGLVGAGLGVIVLGVAGGTVLIVKGQSRAREIERAYERRMWPRLSMGAGPQRVDVAATWRF